MEFGGMYGMDMAGKGRAKVVGSRRAGQGRVVESSWEVIRAFLLHVWDRILVLFATSLMNFNVHA